MTNETLTHVIAVAGGAQELARRLGVSHQAIYKWRARGWVPAARAVEIEELFDVPRGEIISPRLASLLGVVS